MNLKTKWKTESIYVDNQTGEIITKSQFERHYIKIKTTKEIIYHEHYALKKFTTECRFNGQLTLKL